MRGVVGWPPCGDAVEIDPAATRARCEAGAPGSFPPSERELRCDVIETSVRLQAYCEPGGEGRALRYELTMDMTGVDEMLGPRTFSSLSYSPEPGLGNLYEIYAGGGSGGDPPYPVRDAYLGNEYRTVSWLTGYTQPTTIVVFPAVSSRVTTITLDEDGGVLGSSTSDPALFLASAFEHSIP